MHAHLLLTLTAGLLAAPAPADKDPLVGTWVIVSAVRGGKAFDEIKGEKLSFTRDGKLTVTAKNEEEKATYKVDASKKPATIDITFEDRPGNSKVGRLGKKPATIEVAIRRDNTVTFHGIYALEGDTLKICLPIKPGGPRPTKLSSKEGSGNGLIVLKRQKQ